MYFGLIIENCSVIVGIIVSSLAGFEFPDCNWWEFDYVECRGWYIYRGNAAEISVAKCFLKIPTLRILIRVLVNMTNLQILTKLQREFGIAKGAKRGM